MKILHTADWHIGQFKGPVEDGVNLRSLDTIKCLEYMVKVAEEEKPDMVCISGDIFHQEQIGPVRYSDEMVTATRIIEELAECSKFVVVMRGTPNHDGTGQFRVLEKMLSKNKKVAVVTTPQVISTPIADVACIPGFDKQEFRAKFPGLSAEEENLTWTKYISDMVMGLRAQCSNTNIIREKKDRCSAVCAEVNKKHGEVTETVHGLSTQLRLAESDLDSYKKQQEFINNSGCPDIENATCRFLEKAREDVAKIKKTEEEIEKIKESIRIAKEDYATYAAEKKKEIAEIGYSEEQEKNVLSEITNLEIYQKRKDEIDRRKALKARLEGEKASNDKTIVSCTENVSTVKLESDKITENVLKLTETVERYQEAKRISEELRIYADQKTNIPVYAERKKHIAEKLKDLEERERLKNEEWSKLCAEYIRLNEELAGLPEGKEKKLSELERKKMELEEKAASMQVRKGVLLQRIEDTKKANEEINQLKAEISRDAEKAARYEVLKQAFSQDGVPHQIVRNIIPHITDTANNILGQMTGGTMGVEFVMERTVKGKDGDKATLDVLINEYGKTTLPYASKSGGEKVKSSLAVILALSEIKATAAGIQLGMLFIDEPPFLDNDGAQAYVDSLETIRSRYPDVKVMASCRTDGLPGAVPGR